MNTSTYHIDTWDTRTSPAEKLGHISGRYDTEGRECYVRMFPGADVLPITVDDSGNLWLCDEVIGWLPQVRTHHLVDAFKRRVAGSKQMRLI